MQSSRISEKGSYLLEVAVVTMGLVFFIVGAFDVARIFQARGAVRAGVREGLRCLYPTDHGCSGVVSPGRRRHRRSLMPGFGSTDCYMLYRINRGPLRPPG